MKETIHNYQERIALFQKKLENFQKLSLRYSYTRLTIVIFGIPLIYFTSKLGITALLIALLFMITLFIYAVIKQQNFTKKVRFYVDLTTINKNEITSLESFSNLYYNGAKYDDPHHLYSDDLDIFGESSLFGLINRCKTFNGNKYLSKLFLELPEKDEVLKNQEAVKELAERTDWRQEFQASLFDIENGHNKDLAKDIEDQLTFNLPIVNSRWIKYYQIGLPFIWALIVTLYFINVNLANTLLGLFFLGNLLLVISKSKEVTNVQTHLSQASIYLRSYEKALKLIFDQDWKSDKLKETQEFFLKENSDHKIAILSDLRTIIDRLDYRLNFIVAIVLNGFILWDFRVIRSFQAWKEKYNGQLHELFEFVGMMEAMNSLSSWSFNHPKYTFPIFNEEYFNLTAEEIKHPLIPESQIVPNDFNITYGKHLSIVTGSNMSGKSTFLRTIGINMILAYTGTSIAAEKLETPIVKIVSYMRIRDLLEESVSTFKAELNRIELILKLLKEGNKCFILIDEMLRGTNSVDKLKGSIGIAKRLIEEQTYAMIATHDIKLAELGQEMSESISNYYFDIDYMDGNLVFDYKLKKGICQNFNASFLLENLGINMDSSS